MTDYDATLTKFFDEVILFLTRQAKYACDKEEYEMVLKNIERVKEIQKNPKKYFNYDVRMQDGLVEDAEAFMVKNRRDNSGYLLYSRFLWNHMQNLYSKYGYERHEAQKGLERALKGIKYMNSTNIFKDLYFPFVPANRFTVQQKVK